jgi:hemerythrin superfamily protein
VSHVTQELCLLAVALADLHHDHEEVSSLLSQILDATDNHERGELFREMMSKLLAHAKAEQKILYRKLEKSRNSEARKFAFEGEIEHEVVESQLQQLARARNKDSEQ